MVLSEIVEQIREIVKPVFEGTPIELLEVFFLVERGRRILRLFIDKPGGVDLSDCSEVSREISALLEVHNVVAQRYTLEVSSPGLDRLLSEPSDFLRNMGRLLKVTVRKSSGDTQKIVGRLVSCGNEEITLEVNGKEMLFALDQIVKAKLKPRF